MKNDGELQTSVKDCLTVMQKSVQCPICLEVLNNPTISPCHHTFCKFCIEQYLEKKNSAACPICKEKITKRVFREREKSRVIGRRVRDVIAAWEKETGSAWVPRDEPTSLRPFQDWHGEEPNASLTSSTVEAPKSSRGRSKRRRVSFPSPPTSPPSPPLPIGAPPAATASTPAVSLQLQAESEPDISVMEQKTISPNPAARSALEERRRSSGRGRGRRGIAARSAETQAAAAAAATAADVEKGKETEEKEEELEKENLRPVAVPEEAASGGHVMQQLRKVGKRLGGAVGRRSVRRGRARAAEEDVEATQPMVQSDFGLVKEEEEDLEATQPAIIEKKVVGRRKRKAELEVKITEADWKKAEEEKKRSEAKSESERKKAEAKAGEERKRAEAKAEAERKKTEAERKKAEAKAEEERRKAEAKAEEEQRKAEAKAEEEQRKAEADARKAEAKKAAKSESGGFSAMFRRSRRGGTKTMEQLVEPEPAVADTEAPRAEAVKAGSGSSVLGGLFRRSRRVKAGEMAKEADSGATTATESGQPLAEEAEKEEEKEEEKELDRSRARIRRWKCDRSSATPVKIPAAAAASSSAQQRRSVSCSVLLKTRTVVQHVSRTERPSSPSCSSGDLGKRSGSSDRKPKRWARSSSALMRGFRDSLRRKKVAGEGPIRPSIGLPPRPYAPDSESDSSGPAPSRTPPRTPSRTPRTPRTPRAGPGSSGPPSAKQLSARRVLRKYRASAGKAPPLLPSMGHYSGLRRGPLAAKSPGWSRQAQMARDFSGSAKRPLSVQRTWRALSRRGSYSPALAFDRDGTTPSRKENLLKAIKSRFSSKPRPVRAAPISSPSASTLPGESCLGFGANMIDLSHLPDTEDDAMGQLYRPPSPNYREPPETRRPSSQSEPAGALNTFGTAGPLPPYGASQATSCSELRAPMATFDPSVESFMIPDTETGPTSTFSPPSKAARSPMTTQKDSEPMTATSPKAPDTLTLPGSEKDSEQTDSVMVPSSEPQPSQDPDQLPWGPFVRPGPAMSRGPHCKSAAAIPSASASSAFTSQQGEARTISGATSCLELPCGGSELQLQVSADGQNLQFWLRGKLVRQVSAVELWRWMQGGNLLSSLSQEAASVPPTSQNASQESPTSQCTTQGPPCGQTGIQASAGIPTASQAPTERSTQDAQAPQSDFCFTNPDLYSADSEDNPFSRSPPGKSVEGRCRLEQEMDSEAPQAMSTPGAKLPRRTARKRLAAFDSDDDSEEPGKEQEKEEETQHRLPKRRSLRSNLSVHEGLNSEAFYTTQQRQHLHNEVAQMEAELSELQALERMIEAGALDSENADSAVPSCEGLPDDDEVVQLAMREQFANGKGSTDRAPPQTTTEEEEEEEEEEDEDEDEDEPIVIPSSQETLRMAEPEPEPEPGPSTQRGCRTRRGVAEPSEERPARGPIRLAASGLRPDEREAVQRFCVKFGATYKATFEPEWPTHVIMREDGSRPKVVQRTLKFFLGILAKSWIVTVQWVKDCLFAGTLIEEDEYEVMGDSVCGVAHSGPKRSRTISRPLFSDLHLCVVGDMLDMEPEQFQMMVALGGGTSVESPDRFPRHARRRFIVVDRQSSTFSASACRALYRRFHIPVVARDWLFDSIAQYRLFQPTKEYIVQPETAAKNR